MKSKRRHELQQSEMVREFGKLRRFFHKYGNHIAWGVLIAAVIFAIAFYAHRSKQRKQDQLLARLSRAQTAGLAQAEHINELKELTAQQDNLRVAAQAGVMLGDAFFLQYVVGDDEESDFPLTRDEALPQAEDAYRRVIDSYGRFPRQVSRARYGLAKVLETQQRFDDARRQYQAILEMPGLEGDPIVTLAGEDIAAMDNLDQPVKLAQTQPAATTEPSTLPTTQNDLSETPLPTTQQLPRDPAEIPEESPNDDS